MHTGAGSAEIPASMAVPVAHLFGAPVLELPQDLYIPPEALRVFLETFEGPLDLLLYLIRRQNINVLDIPMRTVTAQYLAYVDAMREHQLELAAEYLLMAAVLIDIKARLLLPRHEQEGEAAEDDPRAELVRRLLEYEQMKLAAQALDALPQAGRDFAWVEVVFERVQMPVMPEVSLSDLRDAWRAIVQRAAVHQHHQIQADELSVRETMSRTLARLRQRGAMPFADCFDSDCNAARLVVQFLAILELARESLLEIAQAAPFAAIFICLPGHAVPADCASDQGGAGSSA